MALVQYSDSEGSDSEDQKPRSPPAPTPASKTNETAPSKPAQKFSSLVDRGNPRKIRVALPEIKPENAGEDTGEDGEDGPARKKPKTGAGGGLFSGFNSMLPAPKKRMNQQQSTAATSAGKTGAPPKVFSLRTGATPGFDRQADAEFRQEQALNAATDNQNDIPKPGSLAGESKGEGSLLKEDDYKKKGNAMVFKPLSVARNGPKKKSAAFVAAKAAAKNASAQKPADTTVSKSPAAEKGVSGLEASQASSDPPLPPPKPKVSLFSFSNEEKDTPNEPTNEYGSMLYNPPEHDDASMLQGDDSSLEYHNQQAPSYPTPSTQQNSSLDAIADDLNLSRAQRRQLMGRNPGTSLANSRVVNFNTDTEYAANQEMLSKTTQEELAAQQHNPVRAIAPGKHSLRQLVQAATSQKDALEDSFAAGRRNKKEAGSRYGW